MIAKVKARWQEFDSRERGAVLILTAAMLIVLMGAAAMGTDLGWLYLNGRRTQQAADAAALAGVVYLPNDEPTAVTTALDMARANEYVDGSMGGDATVVANKLVDNDRRLQVTVTRSVDTYFLKVFGIDTIALSRSAVAEYVLPLPLGSPEPQFGNDPECAPNIDTGVGCTNIWANIHGKYTNRVMGDAFSPWCKGSNGTTCTHNEWYRDRGYLFGVELDADTASLGIDLLDPAFVQGGNDYLWAGDNPISGNVGPEVEFTLWSEDPTPLDLSDGNVILCQVVYAPEPVGTPFTWRDFCDVSGADAGVYPLQVRIADENFGLNRYSIRTSAAGAANSRVYGLGDMSIYANVQNGGSDFFLAEVDEVHKGKQLIIELFDPGEANGNNFIHIRDPFGNSPECHVQVPNDSIDEVLTDCIIDATRPARNYNGDWIYVSIDLPGTYSCNGANCWWKVFYDYANEANDTTTWTARIEGNPVRLVE